MSYSSILVWAIITGLVLMGIGIAIMVVFIKRKNQLQQQQRQRQRQQQQQQKQQQQSPPKLELHQLTERSAVLNERFSFSFDFLA